MQTRASLLLRIRNPQDRLAWSEFVRLYAPILHGYAMKNGLQDADAADLAQDVLRNVLRAAPDFVYDPAKGAFRGWLFTIARNQIRKTARKPVTIGTGDSNVQALLNEQSAEDPAEEAWEKEYQLHLFRWAADKVRSEFRETSWNAFWMTIVENKPIDEVAKKLKITSGAVYIARSRIIARIREEVQHVEGDTP